MRYKLKLTPEALTALELHTCNKVAPYGSMPRKIIIGTEQDFLIRIPRVKLTDPETGRSRTQVVLPDFLLPRRQYCTKTLLMFLSETTSPKKSRQTGQKVDLASLVTMEEWDSFTDFLDTPMGKKRSAYIHRHRKAICKTIVQQIQQKNPYAPPCHKPYQLSPDIDPKTKINQAYFTNNDGAIISVAVSAEGLYKPNRLNFQQSLTWPAEAGADNILTASKEDCRRCYQCDDSS